MSQTENSYPQILPEEKFSRKKEFKIRNRVVR